jgi:hypothetical protein
MVMDQALDYGSRGVIGGLIVLGFLAYGLAAFTVSYFRADRTERKRWTYPGRHNRGGGWGRRSPAGVGDIATSSSAFHEPTVAPRGGNRGRSGCATLMVMSGSPTTPGDVASSAFGVLAVGVGFLLVHWLYWRPRYWPSRLLLITATVGVLLVVGSVIALGVAAYPEVRGTVWGAN